MIHFFLLIYFSIIVAISGIAKPDTLKSTFLSVPVTIIVRDGFIDSLKIKKSLIALENSFDKYNANSTLHHVNEALNEVIIDSNLYEVFLKGKEFYKLTKGSFDPSAWDIMKIWQFGEDSVPDVDFFIVDSLLSIGGYENEQLKVTVQNDIYLLNKPDNRTKFAFEGILTGYVLAFLEKSIAKNHKEYLIKIGNDLIVNGNFDDDFFVNMEDEILGFCANIKFQHHSFPSSYGISYSQSIRKFIRQDGSACSQTIDTKSGYPLSHNLIAVIVYAIDPVLADGLATTFMVLGLDESEKFLQNHQEYQVKTNFIYQGEDGSCMVKAMKN